MAEACFSTWRSVEFQLGSSVGASDGDRLGASVVVGDAVGTRTAQPGQLEVPLHGVGMSLKP